MRLDAVLLNSIYKMPDYMIVISQIEENYKPTELILSDNLQKEIIFIYKPLFCPRKVRDKERSDVNEFFE